MPDGGGAINLGTRDPMLATLGETFARAARKEGEGLPGLAFSGVANPSVLEGNGADGRNLIENAYAFR